MNTAIIKIIAYSLAALLLLVLLLVLLKSNWFGNLFSWNGFSINGSINGVTYANADKYSIGNTEVDAAGITTLSVDWISGKVDIVSYDGTKIVVSEVNTTSLQDEEKLHYWLDNGTLYIKFCASGFKNTQLNNLTKKLQIKVPKDHISNLKLNSASADCSITDIGAKDVEINTASGAVFGAFSGTVGIVEVNTVSGETAVRCNADKVVFSSVSGDFDFNGAAISVQANTTSGVIRITTENSTNKIEVNSVSGSAKLFLPETAEFEAQLSSISGTLSCDFPTVILKKNKIKCGNGGIYIDASTVSGDLDIKKK